MESPTSRTLGKAGEAISGRSVQVHSTFSVTGRRVWPAEVRARRSVAAKDASWCIKLLLTGECRSRFDSWKSKSLLKPQERGPCGPRSLLVRIDAGLSARLKSCPLKAA